jgi:hypothetical protein
MSDITVRRIEKSELGRFLRLPFRLYRDDPHWVPPLFSEMKSMLDPEKNHFIKNSSPAYFMAFRGRKAVARVLAGYNTPVSKKTGVPNGYFALFEAEDEQSGLAVMEAAAEYCKSLGAERFFGPQSPTDGEEERALLIEGFGFPPVLYTTYNPEWYRNVFEKFGMVKSKDLMAFLLETDKLPLGRFRRLVRFAEQRYGFHADRIDFSRLEDELRDIQKILGEAAIDGWDSGIPSWELIEQTAAAMKTMADPDFIYIVRTDEGRPIAFVVSIPNFNEALIHMNGRMLPLGIIKFLYWRRRIRSLRILMQFSVKDFEGKGAVSAAYLAIMEKALEKGYRWGEASTIGEENIRSLQAVEGAGGRVYRRFRWFEKAL